MGAAFSQSIAEIRPDTTLPSRGSASRNDHSWREAAIPNIGCVGTAEDRICRSKGHQRGPGKVDSVGLREAVALRNASRSGVGSFWSLKHRIAVTAIWFTGSDVHRLVESCALLTDSGWFEHDLLQAIATGDDDHEVEFAILLHQTSGKSASRCSLLGDAYGVRKLLLN